MDQLFRIERTLQKCNAQLLDRLTDAALNGETVDVPRLMACHAYDLLFCTSTGQRAGFLDPTSDPSKIGQALSDWKFHAVLFGTYLRHHRLLQKVLTYIGYRNQGPLLIEAAVASTTQDEKTATEAQLTDAADTVIAVEESAADNDTITEAALDDTAAANKDTATIHADLAAEPNIPADDDQPASDKQARGMSPQDYEARIAMTLAGADPTITLILKTLHHICNDYNLLLQIRTEIAASKIMQPATFKDIIAKSLDLPMLFATLHESMRAYPMHDIGLSYVVPKGGVFVKNKHIPEDSVVTLESLLAHVNPEYFGTSDWDPERWLTPVAADLKRLLPAYGIRDVDQTIPECQTLLAAQLLAQLLPYISIKSTTSATLATAQVSLETTDTTINFNDDSTRPWNGTSSFDNSAGNTDKLRLQHMEVFGELLGKDGTKALFAEYDPNHGGTYRGKKYIKVGPIQDSTDRFRLHQATGEVYGKRVEHRTDPTTQVMYFAPGGTFIKFDKPRSSRNGRRGQHGRENPYLAPDVLPQAKVAPIRPKPSSPPVSASKPRPPPSRVTAATAARLNPAAPPRAADARWGGWASGEHERQQSFKTAESWALQKEAMAREQASAEGKGPEMKFKENFKQTVRSAQGEQTSPPPKVARKEGFVPPHLRGKQ